MIKFFVFIFGLCVSDNPLIDSCPLNYERAKTYLIRRSYFSEDSWNEKEVKRTSRIRSDRDQWRNFVGFENKNVPRRLLSIIHDRSLRQNLWSEIDLSSAAFEFNKRRVSKKVINLLSDPSSTFVEYFCKIPRMSQNIPQLVFPTPDLLILPTASPSDASSIQQNTELPEKRRRSQVCYNEEICCPGEKMTGMIWPPKSSLQCNSISKIFRKVAVAKQFFSPRKDPRGQGTPTYPFRTLKFLFISKLRAYPATFISNLLSEVVTLIPCLSEISEDNELESKEVAVPSRSFISSLTSGFSTIIDEQLRQFIRRSQVLTLHIDGSTSNRNIAVYCLGITNEQGVFMALSLYQQLLHTAEGIADEAQKQILKFEFSRELSEKIKYILSDTAAAAISSNRKLALKLQTSQNPKIFILRCTMHISASLDRRAFEHYETEDEQASQQSSSQLANQQNSQGRKSAPKGKPEDTGHMLMALKMSFGSRQLASASATDLRHHLEGLLLESESDFATRRVFKTDLGSRYGIHSNNAQMFLIHERLVLDTASYYKTKYAQNIISISKKEDYCVTKLKMGSITMFWEGLSRLFLANSGGSKTINELKQAFIDTNRDFQTIKGRSFGGDYKRLIRLFKTNGILKKSKIGQRIAEKTYSIIEELYRSCVTSEDIQNILDHHIQLSRSRMLEKFESEWKEIRDLPEKGYSLTADNRGAERIFGVLKYLEHSDMRTSSTRIFRQTLAKINKSADWLGVLPDNEAERLIRQAMSERQFQQKIDKLAEEELKKLIAERKMDLEYEKFFDN